MKHQLNALGQNQTIIEKDGFYISHIPQDGGWGVESEDGETAICVNGKFFILNGNHLAKYRGRETLGECMEYFHAHSALKSRTSNDVD